MDKSLSFTVSWWFFMYKMRKYHVLHKKMQIYQNLRCCFHGYWKSINIQKFFILGVYPCFINWNNGECVWKHDICIEWGGGTWGSPWWKEVNGRFTLPLLIVYKLPGMKKHFRATCAINREKHLQSVIQPSQTRCLVTEMYLLPGVPSSLHWLRQWKKMCKKNQCGNSLWTAVSKESKIKCSA